MIRELDFIDFLEARNGRWGAVFDFAIRQRIARWNREFPNREVRVYADYRRNGWVFDVVLPFVLPIRGAA